MARSTVNYQVATYSGDITIDHDPDDDSEIIIAKAKKILRRQCGGLPLGYQSFKVVRRDE